jgi:predicted ABC-type transport system involved in lysophospholipase L1 biosynthesis ATPase subunit
LTGFKGEKAFVSCSFSVYRYPIVNSSEPEQDQAIISADNVYRTFEIGNSRIEVLKGVSLKVQAGEKLFLCGASGAGKTSLLYTLAGLEKPNSGEVFIAGESLYKLSRSRQAKCRNQRMGYVFQSYALLPELTARENVCLPSMIGGKASLPRADDLLDRVGLGDRLHHLPPELSGGEQQRVAIARSLMNDPEILFADEPTGNLDSKTGAEVMDLLLSLVDEQNKTLLVVTHDSSLAQSGDRMLELTDGRMTT